MEDNVNVWKNTTDEKPKTPFVEPAKPTVVKPQVNRLPIVIALSLVVVLLGVILYMLLTSNLNNKPLVNNTVATVAFVSSSESSELSSLASSSQNSSATTSVSVSAYKSIKLGLTFDLPKGDTVNEPSSYTIVKEIPTVITPSLTITGTKYTMDIVKYSNSITYDRYFYPQWVAAGAFSIHPDKISGTNIQKALSYAANGGCNADEIPLDTPCSIFTPGSIVYFTLNQDHVQNKSDQNDLYSGKDLYFVVNGTKYIVMVKLSSMLNGGDNAELLGDATIQGNDYLNKQDLTEIENIVKSIKAM